MIPSCEATFSHVPSRLCRLFSHEVIFVMAVFYETDSEKSRGNVFPEKISIIFLTFKYDRDYNSLNITTRPPPLDAPGWVE